MKNTDNVTIATDHTLYAQWKAKTVTVSFDANGGSVSTSSKTVTIDQKYGSLSTPSRSSYDFDGWYTSRSGRSYINSNTTVTTRTNHTLYAHWTLKYKECECCGKNYYTCSCSSTFCDTCGKCTNCCEGHSSSGGDDSGGSGTGDDSGGGSSSGGTTHSCYACWYCGKCDLTTCPNGKSTCDCSSNKCANAGCAKCSKHWSFTDGYCNYHAGGSNNGGWIGDD